MVDEQRPIYLERAVEQASFINRLGSLLLRLMRIKERYTTQTALLANIQKRRLQAIASPPPALQQKYAVSESVVAGMTVYHMQTRGQTASELIFYLHGGAYVNEFVKIHWDIADRLLAHFGAALDLPRYPLAPEAQVDEVLANILAGYEAAAARWGADHITLMGDSAGGSLSLALAQRLKAEGKPQPKQLVLFSPYLDASLTNPEIPAISPHDVMLDPKTLLEWTRLYAGDRPLTDPLVSPSYGDSSGLAPISIFSGTNDILTPDSRLFVKQMQTAGHCVSYYEYPGAFHVFVAVDSPESRHAFSHIQLGTQTRNRTNL